MPGTKDSENGTTLILSPTPLEEHTILRCMEAYGVRVGVYNIGLHDWPMGTSHLLFQTQNETYQIHVYLGERSGRKTESIDTCTLVR